MKKWILLVMVLLAAILAVIVNADRMARIPDILCEGGFTNEINGAFIDSFCYTPVPTDTTTAVSPSRSETPTPWVTATAEPILTETAVLPTATYIPTSISNPGSVAVMGDSNSEPYEFIDRGGPDGYAWTEVLRDWRDVDFGENDEFIVAHSGDRTTHLARQIDELSQYIKNDQIGSVIIWMGWNDLRVVCNNTHDEPSLQNLKETIFNNLEKSVIKLIELGMSSNHIYMVNQSNRTGDSNCDNLTQVNRVVDEINLSLVDMADEYGINLIDTSGFVDEFSSYIINEEGDISVDSVTIYPASCDRQTCRYTADGHANTVISGIVANVFFADAIGVSRLSDTELVSAARLK